MKPCDAEACKCQEGDTSSTNDARSHWSASRKRNFIVILLPNLSKTNLTCTTATTTVNVVRTKEIFQKWFRNWKIDCSFWIVHLQLLQTQALKWASQRCDLRQNKDILFSEALRNVFAWEWTLVNVLTDGQIQHPVKGIRSQLYFNKTPRWGVIGVARGAQGVMPSIFSISSPFVLREAASQTKRLFLPLSQTFFFKKNLSPQKISGWPRCFEWWKPD